MIFIYIYRQIESSYLPYKRNLVLFKLKETMKELEIKLYNALQNIEGRVISFIESSVKPTTDTHEDRSKSELYHVSSEKNVPSETNTVDSYQPNQDTHAGVSTHDENTLQQIDNVHTSYSESDSHCTRKMLTYVDIVKKPSPQ